MLCKWQGDVAARAILLSRAARAAALPHTRVPLALPIPSSLAHARAKRLAQLCGAQGGGRALEGAWAPFAFPHIPLPDSFLSW